VVQLKLKFADFSIITRRVTLHTPTDDGQVLYRAALEMLERAHAGRPMRLTGVSARTFEVDESNQLGLLPTAAPRSAKLNATLDRIAERFGDKAITTADLSKPSGKDGG
jgi:DNA polymerase IV